VRLILERQTILSCRLIRLTPETCHPVNLFSDVLNEGSDDDYDEECSTCSHAMKVLYIVVPQRESNCSIFPFVNITSCNPPKKCNVESYEMNQCCSSVGRQVLYNSKGKLCQRQARETLLFAHLSKGTMLVDQFKPSTINLKLRQCQTRFKLLAYPSCPHNALFRWMNDYRPSNRMLISAIFSEQHSNVFTTVKSRV